MKNKPVLIKSYVHIRENKVFRDGIQIFAGEQGKHADFLRQVYRNLKISYPKFHKMDSLSKLGILATAVLFKQGPVDPTTALVFSNSNSSLDTDRRHYESMKGIVSPSIFVYTLPNIVMGEISIKYKLQSENSFFICSEFNGGLLKDYSEILLNSGKAAGVVSGWIDLKNEEYDVFLFHLNEEGNIPFSSEKLEQLYRFENE